MKDQRSGKGPDKRGSGSPSGVGRPAYVYILRCGDGTLYTGVAHDVEHRLKQHSRGKGARYTRGRGPLAVVYREKKASLSEALVREAEIKRWNRSRKEKLIRGGKDS